jgi:hypothetical protein
MDKNGEWKFVLLRVERIKKLIIGYFLQVIRGSYRLMEINPPFKTSR